MDFDKFEWLVENQRLFMPTIDRLREKLEGSTPQGFPDALVKSIKEVRGDDWESVANHNLNFLSAMSSKMRRMCFASCWHKNEYENYALWKAYTSSNTAVAIRTTYEKLKSELPDYTLLGLVRYIDYEKDALPLSMNMLEWVMHKDVHYKFEEEARVIVFWPAGPPNEKNDFENNTFESTSDPTFIVHSPVIDCQRLIDEILIHPDASNDFKKRLRNFCDEHTLPKPKESRGTREPIF